MRLRSFAAIVVAVMPLAASCASGDFTNSGEVGGTGGTGVGGSTVVGALGGAVDGVGGTGIGGDATLPAVGGSSSSDTGGATEPGMGGATTTSVGGTGVVDNIGGATNGSGGATTGSGGATSTGGTSSTSGGTANTGGSTSQGNVEYSVDDGGFVSVCGWTGYAWTNSDADSNIEPGNFDGASAGTQLCASGTVNPKSDWTGFAMLGINVGQASGEGTSNVKLVPDGSGIYVDVANNANTELRVQIQDELGDSSENNRWCANYSGPGVIAWSDFNTRCWDGSGIQYNKEPINAVIVVVPGPDANPTEFDFCVNKIEPTGGNCSGSSNPGTGGSGNTGGSTGSTGGSPSSGGQQNSSGGSETLPQLQGGSDGFATRYWDCCKPSCGWTANASNPVDSCDINDNNIGVDDNARNGCEGGPAFTCHNWAPWAVSDTLSYGFAAFNGANCGTCYQIRFSGSSSRGTPTPGIEGKQMIVQVTNIGGIEGNQFDLLIPGGGVGAMNGCSTQWGASDLGAIYGGFRDPTSCGADATCIRNKCQAAFGSSPELMAGCDWYLNWLQMADNPDIRYAPIACPAAITARSGG